MSLEIHGLLGLIIFIADVYAILQIGRSNSDTMSAILWIGVVLILPVIGLIIWYFFGPRPSLVRR